MLRLYYNLAKKSTLMAFLGIFLFSAIAEARIPNDPEYAKQQKMWQQIGAETAWNYSIGSNQVTVAIVDTGADIWHDDLKANVWKNPYEISGNNYDDDGNGYIDDVNGWNFVEDNNDVRTSVLDSTDDADAISHGTAIAGLIGAAGNNIKDGTGLNWNVKLMPLRAIASDGSGSYAQVAKAVRYAVDNGADVISLSVVGTNDDDYLKQILREAYEKGVVIVAAAGNDQVFGNGNLNNTQHFPVCMDSGSAENWIIGVSSVDENDYLSGFANYGSCVDLVAPGQNIFSSQRFAPVYGFNKEFDGPWQGTSFSVPLVAGSAALIKSIRPDWSAKEIINNLLKNSDNVESKNYNHPNDLGFGRLNVGLAAKMASEGALVSYFMPKEEYYFKDNIMFTKQNDKNFYFASTGDASVLTLAATRSLNNKADEVYALTKLGKYYFVQFFTEQGRKWQEKAVPVSDYSSKKIPTGVKVITENGQRKIQINYTEKVVKKGKKSSSKTTSKKYNWLE